MKVIDADAHVIENESTWDYMLESETAVQAEDRRRDQWRRMRSITG